VSNCKNWPLNQKSKVLSALITNISNINSSSSSVEMSALMGTLFGCICIIKVKHAGGSLRDYMCGCDAVSTQKTAETFLSIFRDFHRVDRVTLPLLKTLDQLISSGCFSKLSESERWSCKLHSDKATVTRSSFTWSNSGKIDWFTMFYKD